MTNKRVYDSMSAKQEGGEGNDGLLFSYDTGAV